MMKHKIFALFLVAVLLLSGCVTETKQPKRSKKESQEEDTPKTITVENIKLPALYDDSYIFPEDTFRFSDLEKKQPEAIAAFQYYRLSEGTGSDDKNVLIYRYRDYLVCAWYNFFCGDALCDTFLLTPEQGEAFLQLVENHEVTKEPEETDGEGDDYNTYELKYKDEVHSVKKLKLASIDLDFSQLEPQSGDGMDDHIMDCFDISEDLEDKITDQDTLSDFVPWQCYHAIYRQIEAYTGEQIESAEDVEFNDLEFKLELTLENGDTMLVVATYTGCVVAYQYTLTFQNQ